MVRSTALLACVALAVTLLPSVAASAAGPVTITFDGPPAVVGQSAATAYPEVRFNPDPNVTNLSYICTPRVVADASPSSAPHAVVPWCPGGEFDLPGGLFGQLTSGSTGSVSLRFGGYGTPLATTSFVLEAFDSGNELLASATATGGVGSLTVTAPQPTITAFRIRPANQAAIGFRFWIDDITWMPATVPLPPDFTLTQAAATGGRVSVLEGGTSAPEQLTITPVNGSAGQVTWSVSGLPAGVTGTVTPHQGGGLLAFTAVEGTDGTSATVTVTATPVDAATGTVRHSVTYAVTVSTSLSLSAPATLDVPVCGLVPLTAVAFGPTSPGRLSLTVQPPVPGLVVRLRTQWNPIADSPDAPIVTESDTTTLPFLTGANVTSASHSLLVTVDARTLPADVSTTTLRLTLVGGSRSITRQIAVTVRRPALTLTPTTVRPVHGVPTLDEHTAPPFDRLTVSVAAPVRLCPDSTVKVGAAAWLTPNLSPDGSAASLTVPRDATSGAVQVRSDWFGTAATGPITVQTFRSTSGFSFRNYRPGFDLGDMWEAFGWDVFVKVLGFVPTPIPSPETVILLGVANSIFDGACFGISRASNELRDPARLKLFAPPGAPDAWHLTGSGGPSESLRHRIAALHLTQLSTQFLANFLKARAATAAMTPDQLRGAIATARGTGDTPYLMLEDATTSKKHVVLVYDVRPAGPGAWDLDVYDSNVPYVYAEQAPTPKAVLVHANALAASTVHLAASGDWSLPGTGVSNTGMRGMALMTAGMIPSHASMIKVSTPTELTGSLVAVFGLNGSGHGAAPARITAISSGSRRFVPGAPGSSTAPGPAALPLNVVGLLDTGASARGESWAVDASGGPVSVTVSGTGSGSYRQVVMTDGYAGSVTLPSAAGRAATLHFDAAAGVTGLEHGAARGSVVVEAAGPDGRGGTRTATVTLPGSAAGTDAVRVSRGGDVVVEHRGPAVTATLTLTGAAGGTSSTATVAVPLAAGATTLRPARWDRLSGPLAATGPNGTQTLVMRSPAAPTLRVTALTVAGAARQRVATARVAATGLARGDRLQAVWTAVRGRTVLARVTVPLTGRGPARTARWRLPAATAGARVVVVPLLVRTRGLAVTTVTGRPAAGR